MGNVLSKNRYTVTKLLTSPSLGVCMHNEASPVPQVGNKVLQSFSLPTPNNLYSSTLTTGHRSQQMRIDR